MKPQTQNFQKRATRLESEAFLAFQRKQIDEALLLYRRAAKMNERAGNSRHVGFDYFQLAAVERMRQSPRATFEYQKALTWFRKAGAADWAHKTLLRLVESLIDAGEFERAVTYTQELHELEAAGDDLESLYKAILFRSMALYGSDQAEAGNELVDETIRDSVLSGHKEQMAWLAFLTDRKDVFYDDFETYVREEGHDRLLGHVLQQKATNTFMGEDVEGAIPLFTKARQLAVKNEDPLLYFQSSCGLLLAHEELGNHELTFQYLMRTAVSLSKTLGKPVIQPLSVLHDALREKWGEEVYAQVQEKLAEMVKAGDAPP